MLIGRAWPHVAGAALALLCLAGCSSIEHKPQGFAPALAAAAQAPNDGQPGRKAARKIAIFFDGTANDEGSDTNVKRLHSLVTLQHRGDIASLYLHGVGVNFDLAGAATGGGINARVRIAYEFVLNHYRHAGPGDPPDEIYIFGFSRGAFAARVLTSMLHHAGVVREDTAALPAADTLVRQRSHTDITDQVHRLVFPEAREFDRTPDALRRARVQAGLAGLQLRADNPLQAGPARPVPVAVLGLWDTVEALGAPSWPRRILHKLGVSPLQVNVDVPNPRYGDTLCNVQQAYHAVSIDDNRAWIFTPVLLTRQHLFTGCTNASGQPGSEMQDAGGNILPGRLQEVWFAGAHSDVGGGYQESALSGVSLNWMIDQLGNTGLLPPGAAVRADPHGSSHDPEAGLWSVAYHAINRDVLRYALDDQARAEFRGTLCVHASVFERRQRMAAQAHENQQWRWAARGTVLPRQEPNAQDYGWPWFVLRDGQPGTAAQAVVIGAYPECSNMLPNRQKDLRDAP